MRCANATSAKVDDKGKYESLNFPIIEFSGCIKHSYGMRTFA